MRSSRWLVSVCFITLSCAFATFAMAFPPFGATQSGTHNIDNCPAGEFLVEVDARSGNWMDQISITCAKLDPTTMSTPGPRSKGPPRGGNGGNPTSKECNPDHIIRGVGITIRGMKGTMFVCSFSIARNQIRLRLFAITSTLGTILRSFPTTFRTVPVDRVWWELRLLLMLL